MRVSAQIAEEIKNLSVMLQAPEAKEALCRLL